MTVRAHRAKSFFVRCWQHALVLAVLCSSLLVSRSAQSPEDCGCNPLTQAFTDQLRAVEQSRYAAMTANDLKALSTLLGDDLIYAHSNGMVQTKTEFLHALRSGNLRYRQIHCVPQSVRFYGDVAIVNGSGRFEVTAAGREVSSVLVYTAVYRQRGETLKRWELISWHSSNAPASVQSTSVK